MNRPAPGNPENLSEEQMITKKKQFAKNVGTLETTDCV